MSFQDLDELLGSPKKELPIGGRLVTFPDRVSAETGVIMLRIAQIAKSDPAKALDADTIVSELLDDEGWARIQAEVLGGDPQTLMLEHNLTGDRLAHVFKTLMAWHLYGKEVAEKAWAEVGPPAAPNRATRRRKTPAKSSPARGSRGGSTTPKAVQAAEATSPGDDSSPTGP